MNASSNVILSSFLNNSTTAEYHDTLDNLTSTTITGGISARNTLHNIDATTNRLDSITNGPPGFNVSYGYDSRGNVTQRNSRH
jgi:subtilase family serine protease